MSHQDCRDTIYVYLLAEGSPAYRPVPAVKMGDAYLLQGEEFYDPENEKWEFPPGSRVMAEEKELFCKKCQVARYFANDDRADTKTSTVYVQLLGEGLEEWRPVPAVKMGDAYLLQGEEFYDPENEKWEFPPGSRVMAEEKEVCFRGKYPVAVKTII